MKLDTLERPVPHSRMSEPVTVEMCLETLGSKELLHRPIRFANRVAVIHRASEIGVGEGDSTVRLVSQNVARRRSASRAKEKAGLRIHVRVSPAIQYDRGDVSTWIEAGRREHVAELLSERALVLREGCAE